MGREKPLWERMLEALGFNTMRLRWKLQQREIERERRENRAANERRSLSYEHKLCPSCSLTVDRDAKVCPRCQRPLASATMTRLGRYLRRVFPEGSYSYSLFFVAVNVIFYVAMVLQSGGPEALFSGPNNRVALRFGAWFVPLLLEGEWWRLVTPTFLHFGTLHLVFNCLWLAQLGPGLEQLLGRSRFLVFYVVTGAGGFVVSIGYRVLSGSIGGVGGGASGVVFGLIAGALTLAYVRKAPGTSFFKEGLLKWALFGVVMSFLPGIDLAAHLGGALFGSLLALGMATRDQARRLSDRLWLLFELLCLFWVVGAFALTVACPPTALLKGG